MPPDAHAEVWLRGPVTGVDPILQPVAHAMLQAVEDVEQAAGGLSDAQLWETPCGAASVGFHLKHLAGSLDRLLTYARGEQLSSDQRAILAAEKGPTGESSSELTTAAVAALHKAVEQVRATPREILTETREVGGQRLPSTVIGLLFHAAEHAQRHVGQIIVTARVVRGLEA